MSKNINKSESYYTKYRPNTTMQYLNPELQNRINTKNIKIVLMKNAIDSRKVVIN